MNFKELNKRVVTSVVLLLILIFSVFSTGFYFNILLFLILSISIYEWHSLSKKSYIYFIFGTIIILGSVTSAFFLRGDSLETKYFFLWILSVVFFSDIGGYTFGKIFGGKKLTKISPNKTISGMIGSFIFSIFPILIIHFLFYQDIFNFNNIKLTYKTFILSLIFSLVCQLGDILVSFFKRKNKKKDTGNILPGHGGILDRIDGLIFLLLFIQILKFLKVI